MEDLQNDFFDFEDEEELNFYEDLAISSVNLNQRTSKLEYLQAYILLESLRAARKEFKSLKGHIKDEAKKEEDRLKYIYNPQLALPESLVSKFFKESDFSDRVWTNQQELVNRLKTGLVRSVNKGENPKSWAKSLRSLLTDEYKKSSFAANRIAVTETAKIQIKVQLESFKQNGYKKVVWICEPDACKICLPNDGKEFYLDKIEDVPPLHPFCRCSLAARYSDDEEENKENPENVDKSSDVGYK